MSELPELKIEPISNFRPQEKNANAHTERGMGELEKSIEAVGFVAPLTVAQDNQAIDGSARLETIAPGLLGDEAIVIEHDGTRPIVMRRVDIPSGDSEIARSIAIRANRVAELNLNWQPDIVLDSAHIPGLETLFYEDELREITGGLSDIDLDKDDGEDDLGSTGELLGMVNVVIAEPKHKVEHGQVWAVGNHFLICASVFLDWTLWGKYLVPGTLFAPFAGPFIPLSKNAEKFIIIMVQPDRYIAGHILDRYEEINGSESIWLTN